jgi:cell wall-associated NlpC family hydrolase
MKNYLLALFAFFGVGIAFCNTAGAAAVEYKFHRLALCADSLATDSVSPDSLIQFAENLIGTRYRSACSDPKRGFDCSGFVSYVFKWFKFKVPRSSPEFINFGKKIRLEDSKPGDIIVFTGIKRAHSAGHVGIIYSNNGEEIKFIHSTSGKEHGVTITTMDDMYRHRFIQVVRVLKVNDNLPVVLASN